MLTHFELKNRPVCRCFYKIPYFIKNLILLLMMFAIQAYVYFVTYLGQELSVNTVYKLIGGLNSQTFNFLTRHYEELMIT